MADLKSMTAEFFLTEVMPKAVAKHVDDLRGLKAVAQWKLAGAGGGDFYIDLGRSQEWIQRGMHPKPDVTVETTAEVMMTIVRGEASPPQLMQSGKVKVSGNPGLMMPLQIVMMSARKLATAL